MNHSVRARKTAPPKASKGSATSTRTNKRTRERAKAWLAGVAGMEEDSGKVRAAKHAFR
jgi:hypothetical protein